MIPFGGEQFDAEQFVIELNAGAFNGQVQEEIRKLTKDQLNAVADILLRNLQQRTV